MYSVHKMYSLKCTKTKGKDQRLKLCFCNVYSGGLHFTANESLLTIFAFPLFPSPFLTTSIRELSKHGILKICTLQLAGLLVGMC